MECVDCKDTGAVSGIMAAGDFCTCEAGKELRQRCFELDQAHHSAIVRAEMTFEGCGNIDTEAECPEDCPDRDEEGFRQSRLESYQEMLPYLLPTEHPKKE